MPIIKSAKKRAKQNIVRKCSENDLERIKRNEADAKKNIKL